MAGVVYKLIAIFPLAVGNDLDLIVRYQAADVSDTVQIFQTNNTLIKALADEVPRIPGRLRRSCCPRRRTVGTGLWDHAADERDKVEKQKAGLSPGPGKHAGSMAVAAFP